VDDLVDVDHAVSGRILLDRRPIDMARSVNVAAGGIAARVTDRHIEIAAESTWIDGDGVRIEQVVTNLLTNAVKFTGARGRIRVALCPDGHDALLTVEDTGIGISSELLPLIFGVFVQGDRTLARTEGGLGIGLPLVRRLVELHGGTIEASSDGAGRGSRFTVRVPRIPAPEPVPAIAPSPDPVIPRRVLLIEDNPDAREMLRLLLTLQGHVVHDAAEGGRGLQLLEEHPDVALIDIGLPGLDGYQVARRIREHPNGRAMLLVALTGYGLPSDHQKSLEAGFDHHLVKPVDVDDLARLLNTNGLSQF
jgi:CheY-like chemotaxis protein/anti-sigma regulatory factor (Ser/Thr protein kinase)